MSSHLKWLPSLALLLPLLLMMCAPAVSGQNGTSILASLIVNKIERCIDKISAIADIIGAVGGAY